VSGKTQEGNVGKKKEMCLLLGSEVNRPGPPHPGTADREMSKKRLKGEKGKRVEPQGKEKAPLMGGRTKVP